MIVQHQKQQQSICKLPSWKYMQTRREDCSGWKRAVIPRSFLHTRKFTDSTCSTVQSHTSCSPHLPVQEWLLKCERSRLGALRSLSGHPVLPFHAAQASPQHKEAASTTTFHQLCSSSVPVGVDIG